MLSAFALASRAEAPRKFDFGAGAVAPGYTQVLPTTTYSPDRGFGLEPGATPTAVYSTLNDPMESDQLASDKPFLFSVDVPEGNYRVSVVVGAAAAPTSTTIKSELRRLSVEKAETRPGKFKNVQFVVNVRTPAIDGATSVRLKDREKQAEMVNWDGKLTLEFNGARPSVCAVEIERVEVPTVFLLGDSTVCDQPAEPWNSWGQMLPRFFSPTVAVANYAQSGESLKSSRSARRLEKVLSLMKVGDYVLIQFGHNDMKERGAGIGAFTSYKVDLKQYVHAAKAKGGVPVLVTSMHRKSLNAEGKVTNTLNDYPEAVRQVAKEEGVALIDLHEMSARLYEALGKGKIDRAFQDGSHHNNYGSYELAKCVAAGIKGNVPRLAKHLAEDFGGFDPGRPDDPEKFVMPASPAASGRKPEGN